MYDENDRTDCTKATAGDGHAETCLGRAFFPGPRSSYHHVTVTPIRVLARHKRAGALIVAFAVVGLALAAPPAAPAQFGGLGGQGQVGGQHPAAQAIKIKSPVASQVFQRDANGRAVIPLALDESVKDATVVDATVTSENPDPSPTSSLPIG